MTKGKAIVLGIFSIWPIVYMVFFMFSIFAMMFLSISHPPAQNSGPPLLFLIIFPLHFLTIIEIFVLLAIYMIFLFKTDYVKQDQKALWAVVLFMGNTLAMPVFWYIYVWKNIQSEQDGLYGTANPPRNLEIKEEK